MGYNLEGGFPLSQQYINEQLLKLNESNRPTKTVSFDGGIYSVGSDVVNGQVSDVVIKGRSLKNELNYNPETWEEWTTSTGVQKSAEGLTFTTSTTTARRIGLNTNLKYSTTYGMLYYVAESTVSRFVLWQDMFSANENMPKNVGHNKIVMTTRSISEYNRIDIGVYKNTEDEDNKVLKVKNLRMFELPAGSEIEADFNTLTADQLAQKYPYINGDSVKSTNSVRVKSVGKNLFDKDLIISAPEISKKVVDGKNVLELTSFATLYKKIIYDKHFTPDKQYTITLEYKAIEDSFTGRLGFIYSDGTISNMLMDSTSWETETITSSLSRTVAGIGIVAFSSSSEHLLINLDSIIISEGAGAIPYEPYKESIVNINLPEPLRSLPNGVKDEISITEGKRTQRVGNKTNVASGTAISYADMATGGQFVAYYADGTQQVGAKGDTLTADATSIIYQLATPIVTKLPAQAPLQVYENGTVYVEPIGDPSETTLPTVEMTIPTGNSNKFGVASHNYDGAAADWVLTNSESKCFLLAVSNADGAANIIAPDAPGAMYAISNASGYAITIKISDGSGVEVVDSKTVLVIHNGTDYTALTAEL